jgi:hypothetical protein
MHGCNLLINNEIPNFEKCTFKSFAPNVTQWGLPMLTHVTCHVEPSTSNSAWTTALFLVASNLVGMSGPERMGSPISTFTWKQNMCIKFYSQHKFKSRRSYVQQEWVNIFEHEKRSKIGSKCIFRLLKPRKFKIMDLITVAYKLCFITACYVAPSR